MLNNEKITVVLPAYKAGKTLRKTYEEIPLEIVDEVILVDDASGDMTAAIGKELGLKVFVHERNKGYGANQKTCYNEAIKSGSDIVIMLHPDYQYTPRLVAAMASMIAYGEYDMVMASRILVKSALRGGMPLYKYVANRFLTLAENVLLGAKFSEYHTGYRAYSSEVLKQVPYHRNSDDFVFDNQFVAQAHYFGFRIGEISCPTKYFKEASSINFSRSVVYGFGVLKTAFNYFLAKRSWYTHSIFHKK